MLLWEQQVFTLMRTASDSFSEKSRFIHGLKYDYSKVIYRSNRIQVEIICPTHGSFRQRPYKHLKGQGCPSCGKSLHKPHLSQDEFMARAKSAHGNAYDYSKVVYRGSKTKVEIVCPIHGSFFSKPEWHWVVGNGCPSCGRTRISEFHAHTQDDFITLCKAKWGDRYDYSDVRYCSSKSKITIICSIHGSFQARPDHHLKGVGCPACGIVKRSDTQRKSTEQFVSEAKNLHGETYDYSRVIYTGALRKIEISCPKHGLFQMTPSVHLHNGLGCPSCSLHYTFPHKQVEMFVKSLGVQIQSNIRSIIPPKELDIFIPERSLAIEMNGAYWHSLTEKATLDERMSHRDKFNLCHNLGIRLLQIDEFEWKEERVRLIWQSIIASKLKKHHRIYARNTEFRVVSRREANIFLECNHLQGVPFTAKWYFGLSYQRELVTVAAFSMHEKKFVNLTRLAFKKGLTVVGGAQKVFKNSLPFLPALAGIITFSDNRYSDGSIYPLLGFVKDKDLPPSYQWFFKNRMFNKRLCRHSRLGKLLGTSYNPSETEHKNMYRNGARCLYDAGYQRWICLPATKTTKTTTT